MNYITSFPYFWLKKESVNFLFQSRTFVLFPMIQGTVFSLKLVCGWFTVTHFVLAAGPASKASMLWAVPLQNLGLKLLWVWGNQAELWTTPECKLVCGSLPCQSTSLYLWEVPWVILLPVFPFFCSTFHHGLHVLSHFWCFLGIFWFGALRYFFFFFFFKSKTGRVGVWAGSVSQKAFLAALEGK